MNEVRTKISPPWVTYVHKLAALFDGDPHIAFNVDWNVPSVTIALSKKEGEKAAAITKLLPSEVQFGNIALQVNVECETMSNRAFTSAKELFETAFKGNPCFAYCVVPASEYWAVPFTYVVFKKEVVQFFNDNLNDPHGIVSTLYQTIAEEVFEYPAFSGGISYCTAVEEANRFGVPLGEWP